MDSQLHDNVVERKKSLLDATDHIICRIRRNMTWRMATYDSVYHYELMFVLNRFFLSPCLIIGTVISVGEAHCIQRLRLLRQSQPLVCHRHLVKNNKIDPTAWLNDLKRHRLQISQVCVKLMIVRVVRVLKNWLQSAAFARAILRKQKWSGASYGVPVASN